MFLGFGFLQTKFKKKVVKTVSELKVCFIDYSRFLQRGGVEVVADGVVGLNVGVSTPTTYILANTQTIQQTLSNMKNASNKIIQFICALFLFRNGELPHILKLNVIQTHVGQNVGIGSDSTEKHTHRTNTYICFQKNIA